VVAAGNVFFHYQWYANGSLMSGQTNATLYFANPQLADAGSYSILVWDDTDFVFSSPASLTVLAPPQFAIQPSGQSAASGSSVTLSAYATGYPPPSYQWLLNGVAIPGANRSAYTITNTSASSAGYYSVIVSNSLGSVASSSALITTVGLQMCATLDIAGPTNLTYRIDYRSSLATNWLTIADIQIPASPYTYVDLSSRGQQQRFYRVVPH